MTRPDDDDGPVVVRVKLPAREVPYSLAELGFPKGSTPSPSEIAEQARITFDYTRPEPEIEVEESSNG